ncbi:P-loop containing nucleoside triphosphate hydrolase protein [Xylariomycetidae sp. FL0641]|nr:P-loop containing nucleoside triphosphate hydrolase protein [Xylariomycetidae sp. FL0641]
MFTFLRQVPLPSRCRLLYKQASRLPSTTRGLRAKRAEAGAYSPIRKRQAFSLSKEQQAIVDICRTENVVVSARPGAGKTATAEAIVAANPDKRVVIVTFSNHLKRETASRLAGYSNCDVFTFHGMARSLFGPVAYTDSVIRDHRAKKRQPHWSRRPYDIVIFDELQDCTELLYWLKCTFIADITRASGRAPQIVALGDEKQAIFNFTGADARFLTHCPDILGPISPYKWTHLPLTRSFRLSNQSSQFVNEIVLAGENYITGSHEGPRPLYLHGCAFDFESRAKLLHPYIQKYGPGNTAILAPSIRCSKTLPLLTNHLSDYYGYQIAVSTSDEQVLDNDVLKGKIAASTYHQLKGLERDLVIVDGATNKWFKYFGKDLPDDRCPNQIFVALTRAKKQLVVLHDHDDAPMPFVPKDKIPVLATYKNYSKSTMKAPPPAGRPPELGLNLPSAVSVSEMARHVKVETVEHLINAIVIIDKVEKQLPKQQHINAPDKTITDTKQLHYEAVSDLNGIAVVAAYEHTLFGTLSTLNKKDAKKLNDPPPPTNNRESRAKWFCRHACKYESEVSHYRSRYLQMRGHSFDWLGSSLHLAVERLETQFLGAGELAFETELEEPRFAMQAHNGREELTTLLGRADIICFKWECDKGAPPKTNRRKKAQIKSGQAEVTIWEVKFVAQLNYEHIVQACTYAYLWTRQNRPESLTLPRIILFNVRDGEKWELSCKGGFHGLRTLILGVLWAKYTGRSESTIDDFLKMCEKVRREVENVE